MSVWGFGIMRSVLLLSHGAVSSSLPPLFHKLRSFSLTLFFFFLHHSFSLHVLLSQSPCLSTRVRLSLSPREGTMHPLGGYQGRHMLLITELSLILQHEHTHTHTARIDMEMRRECGAEWVL